MPLPWKIAGVLLFLASNTLAQLTQRVSLSGSGTEVHGRSLSPVLSADGRFVAFVSEADDLVPGDTNGVRDVFVRDRIAGTT